MDIEADNSEIKEHIFAQCKAYHKYEDMLEICKKFLEKHETTTNQVYLSVPHTFIRPLSAAFLSNQIQIGANSMLSADSKEFTSSICTKMLQDAKAKFVLIGTANEREFHKEENSSLKAKLTRALNAKIAPFLCLNDTEIEFHDGKSKEILKAQLKNFIEGLTKDQLSGLHIIYDASWITKSPWEASDEIIFEAIQNFSNVVSESVDPEVLSTLHLIAPLPSSPDLTEILVKLKNPPFKFHGFSFGLIH